MKSKKVQCPVCGTHNWSGVEYCKKCSGAIYEEKETTSTLYPTLSIFNNIS